MIPVELSRIIISETQETQVIVLQEKGGTRVIPIWIGLFEAVAINRKIRGEVSPRPMTHDLLAEMVGKLGGTLEKVTIDRFIPNAQGGVFHAKLSVNQNGKAQEVDCRPSDAIALAVRLDAPLFVAEEIMVKEGQSVGEGEEPEPPPSSAEGPARS